MAITNLAVRALGAVSFCLAFLLSGSSALGQCPPGEVDKLVASNGQVDGLFGYAVAVDGDTAVVGAPGANVAHVLMRDQGGRGAWGTVLQITGSDSEAGDGFGGAVAIEGDRIVVGSPAAGFHITGAAYVFDRNHGGPGNWGQVAKLSDPDPVGLSDYGGAVGVSGDAVVVAARYKPLFAFNGVAYLYREDQGGAGNWGLAHTLVPADGAAGDQFGFSVSLDGDTAVISAATGNAAYVFERNQGGPNAWGESHKIVAANPLPELFGYSVKVDGDRVLVGAPGADDTVPNQGAVYLFERDLGGAGNWGQSTRLLTADGSQGDMFGSAVSLDGDAALVAAASDDGAAPDAGSVYRLRRGADGVWVEAGELFGSDAGPSDGYGTSVALQGDEGFVGTPEHDQGAADAGAVYRIAGVQASLQTVYCTSKPSSLAACVPMVFTDGAPSASATSGFMINGVPVPGGNQVGVFFYSHLGSATPVTTPFGSLCIDTGAVFRTAPIIPLGIPGQCNGGYQLDWNAHAQSVTTSNPASTIPGTTVDGQFWYRDPPNPGGANLTQAIAFTICP